MMKATIPIRGTIREAAGNLFNGGIRFILSYGASKHLLLQDLVVATEVDFPIDNGRLPASAEIVPNDVLHPSHTTYTAQYLNKSGKLVAQNVFYISGNSFDIGSATPTPQTTSNISFDIPVGTGSPHSDAVRHAADFPGADAGQ